MAFSLARQIYITVCFRLLAMLPSCKPMKLTSYDLIGFDLDNTLCTYNLPELFKSHFNYMAKYLKENGNYSGFNDKFDDDAIDFISRGLLLDFENGNLLKLSKTGEIVRASHGTRILNRQDIEKKYGQNRRWAIGDNFIRDRRKHWLGETSNTTRSMMDFTDVAATVIFARAVDSAEDIRQVWPDVLNSIISMYSRESEWSRQFYKNFSSFAYKTDDKVLTWMRKLKQKTKLALITSSGPENAQRIAEHALGPSWKDLFDVIVYNAQKPWFFTEFNKPFKDLNGSKVEFRLNGEYIEGSCDVLKKTMKSRRLVYVGDSFIHDMVAPDIDVIALVQEAKAEGIFPGGNQEETKYLTSKFWGSLFYEGDSTTLFGDIVFKTNLCIPNVNYLAELAIDETLEPFWNKNKTS